MVGSTREAALRIALAAKRLNDLREGWLNPAEWVRVEAEVVPYGMSASPYPPRVVPRPDLGEREHKELQARTMTNLYNTCPDWLASAHRALDEAVATAYGFEYRAEMANEQVHTLLITENRTRATSPATQMPLAISKEIAVRPASGKRRGKVSKSLGEPVQTGLLGAPAVN